MLTSLRIKNFKSWADTGQMRLAPITGLFGTNSSGKTSILQMLLLLKQTAESTDRAQVLHLGDERSLVDLGTFRDAVHGHALDRPLHWSLSWRLPKSLAPANPEGPGRPLFAADDLTFAAELQAHSNGSGPAVPSVLWYNYVVPGSDPNPLVFGVEQADPGPGYALHTQGFEPKRTRGRPWQLPPPVKCYGFPDQVFAYYQNTSFLADLELAFEEFLGRVYYLGPLRDYPRRQYAWSGGRPSDMGRRGERVVDAILASRGGMDRISRGRGRPKLSLEGMVASWLRELGLIHSFAVRPIAEGSNLYQVLVRRFLGSEEVPITDVGFGVSQVLPVLTLCYYVPEGSTIILEQPEIHLHPSVQAGLADVIIHAVKTRKVQVILESHSEHLLRRLQRRIAEEKLAADDAALFFCDTTRTGVSRLEPLDLDMFGNITNWPEGFFGDEMGELAEMTRAQLRRRIGEPRAS
jgi:predicted ATPase